jgi:hypothetical protein
MIGVAPLYVGCCTPLLPESVIVPAATIGEPLTLVDSWYVPVIVACALLVIVKPPAPILVHVPFAALNARPDRLPVFVIFM